MVSPDLSLTVPGAAALLTVYGGLMLWVTRRYAGSTDAEAFVVADRDIGYGLGTASMSATWIWAASMYAAATAAYTYGLSGAFHYAFWGGLALLFVWKYGQRVRAVAVHGHTFPEWIRARHGRLSQGVMATENYLNSQYSLILNFTAGAAILSLFSPLGYNAALVVIAVMVVSYAAVSGIRASVVTDVVQVGAMVLVAAVAVPTIAFNAGGPARFAGALEGLGAQGDLWSLDAVLGQGAPMMALILAYAFANPTVWQRVFAVRARSLGPVYISSGLLYMALVFSVGTLGFVALVSGITPVDGDNNTIVPAVAGAFLPAWMALPFVVLVVAAITSTSDSDLAALSSIAMTDLWKGTVRPTAGDAELKAVARLSMIVVALVAVVVATLRLDILTLILVYGMIRAASVFPIAASIVWDRVSDAAFTAGVLGGIVAGIAARVWSTPGVDGTSTLSRTLAVGVVFGVVASVGAAGMAGCLAYPFVRVRTAGLVAAAVGIATLVLQAVNPPGLLTYNSLLSTLVALGVGLLVCTGVTVLGSDRRFDWASMDARIRPLSPAAAGTEPS